MDDINGLGAVGDKLFHLSRVNVESLRVDIGINRGCALLDNNKRGGNKGDRGDDDFVAGAQTDGLRDDMQTGGAVGNSQCVLHAELFRKHVLEFLNLRTHGQGILMHCSEDRFLFCLIVNAAEEGIRNLQMYAFVDGIAAGNAAFCFFADAELVGLTGFAHWNLPP